MQLLYFGKADPSDYATMNVSMCTYMYMYMYMYYWYMYMLAYVSFQHAQVCVRVYVRTSCIVIMLYINILA